MDELMEYILILLPYGNLQAPPDVCADACLHSNTISLCTQYLHVYAVKNCLSVVPMEPSSPVHTHMHEGICTCGLQ